MTNDKTVTMSRELAESALTIVARNCTSNWSARVRDGIEAALSAPVVERQDCVIINGMYFSHKEILEWREKNCAELERQEPVAWIKPDVAATLRGDECCYAFGEQNKKGTLIPLYTSPPAPVVVLLTMKDIAAAMCIPTGFPMLTSDQCHALAQAINKVKELNQ